MDLELINKLFLEISQFATATTAKEVKLLEMLKDANDVLRSSAAIASRKGESVNWDAYIPRLSDVLKEQQDVLFPLNDANP